MGSGTYSALAQMAAAGLGVSRSQVTVELGDTWLPEGPFSGGSQVTASVTPAVDVATARLRATLARMAVTDERSPLSGRRVEDLDFPDGMIRCRSGNVGELLTDLLARGAAGGIEAEGESAATQLQSLAVTSMGYGAVFVEVGVDAKLGEIRVRRVCGAFAAGCILNPLLAKSQYVGGMIGGIGMALHEMTVTDRAAGHILGDTFADYLIPVHADMPEFDIAMVDEEDQHLPGGVNGIGMLGTAGIQAAIANSVFHAIGKRVRSLPIRIDTVIG
jgi:xanthine dehydrogenase YagR molybdenum-binding subunit